jgi:hypothetical protein
VVHRLTVPRRPTGPIRALIGETLAAVRGTLDHVAAAAVTTDPALHARRDLQRALLRSVMAYEYETGGTARQRDAAESLWPAVAAAQRLGYRVLAICWSLEEAGPESARAMAVALATPEELVRIRNVLAGLGQAFRTGATTMTPPPLPAFLQTEIGNLAQSLVADADAT